MSATEPRYCPASTLHRKLCQGTGRKGRARATALATIQPAFTDAERLALARYLAGYRSLTREAYALDLRQFTTWCRARSPALFAVRRADIESLARDLDTKAKGRARATVTRRLCTIAPGLAQVALAVKPTGYIGPGWRTSRSKILDNAVIGYCKLNKIPPART